MNESNARRLELLDKKIVETVHEAIVRGLNPFLCVLVLQTFDGLTIRAVGDSRVVPHDEIHDEFLGKMSLLVDEYCSKLSTIEVTPGSGPS